MKHLVPLLLAITTCLAMETNQASLNLASSAWQVTSIAGHDPLAGHPITFEFDAGGNIAGNASCNRFGGACTIERNKIKVGPLRSTRRACEPEVMQQEQEFLALLGGVTAWEIDTGGLLVLRSEDGEIHAAKHAVTSEN